MNFRISAHWRLRSCVAVASPCCWASAWMARDTASSRSARTASSRVNDPVFDQRPIERNNGADRRHRVRRVVEWLHFTLSDGLRGSVPCDGRKGRMASLP